MSRLSLLALSVLAGSSLLSSPVSVSAWPCGISNANVTVGGVVVADGTQFSSPARALIEGGTTYLTAPVITASGPSFTASASAAVAQTGTGLVWGDEWKNVDLGTNGNNGWSAANPAQISGTLTGCTIPSTQTNYVTSFSWSAAYWDPSMTTVQDSIQVTVDSTVLPSSTVVGKVWNNDISNFWAGPITLSKGTHTIKILISNSAWGGYCPYLYTFSVTCTQSGAKGDPQFTGFLGQDFQVHGQSGAVYNVLSSPTFQYNALFKYLNQGNCRPGTLCFSHPGNYFGEVGVMVKDAAQLYKLRIVSGSVTEGMKVLMNDVELIPSEHHLTLGEYDVSFPNQFELFLDSPEFSIKMSNSDYFLNQDVSVGKRLMTAIAAHKQAQRTNATAALEMEQQLPHGILGQTWQLKTHNNRWKFIEGHLYDYMLNDGLFGSEFEYNRFE